MYASMALGKEGVEALIRHDADVNLVSKHDTALTYAVKEGRVEVAKSLLEKHAWPNGDHANGGKTPLSIAINNRSNGLELVKALLENPTQGLIYEILRP